MKTINLKFTAILLIMAGNFACEKENDIDMSQIDFSNIENLYAQPLPVIQKAVQGKWKWTTYVIGFNGAIPVNSEVVEISKDEFITDKGIQRIVWQEREVESHMGIVTTYVMCESPDNVPICFFEHIKNDTMQVNVFQFRFNIHEFIRIKNK